MRGAGAGRRYRLARQQRQRVVTLALRQRDAALQPIGRLVPARRAKRRNDAQRDKLARPIGRLDRVEQRDRIVAAPRRKFDQRR